MIKRYLVVCVFFLLVISTLDLLSFGHKLSKKENLVENYVYDRYLYPEYYDCYNASEITGYSPISVYECNDFIDTGSEKVNILKETPKPLNGSPMDSPWPMYCHDVRHTGRSPYSTINSQDEIWRFKEHMNYFVLGSPIVSNDGTVYFGGLSYFYALYPNGTLKWRYDEIGSYVWSAPAIDENGIIYVGDGHGFLHAINPDGSKKWSRYFANDIGSSPAIGDDGTIYFGDSDNYINALYSSNGSVKWRYKTGLVVYSSPAIGEDGTIYCGSHDTYLYALYPNNGTLKWRYKTGNWIRTSPCIADDGTIYVVSLDNYLHAVNPNGTRKWRVDVGAGTSPTIGLDGTIYAGYEELHAINPINGSVKWKFNPGSGRTIRGATPCHSLEGIIYFGTYIGSDSGGEIIAVNPDGTERWREKIANRHVDSAPAIGSDGTIYVGSACSTPGDYCGYLHAFGKIDPNAPTAPSINGKTSGKPGREYEYSFKSISPLGRDVYYYINWGDNTVKDWFGSFSSGEEVKVSHSYSEQGTYKIKARAKDTDNLWGPWGELQVNMPREKALLSSLICRILENFPFLNLLLQRLRI